MSEGYGEHILVCLNLKGLLVLREPYADHDDLNREYWRKNALDLRDTNVTAKGVAELSKTVPLEAITWDGPNADNPPAQR